MKNTTKDNKGITLIALIITIIIMLILGSVTAYTGINSYKSSRVNKFVMQMQLLQTNFDELISTKTAVELEELGLQSVTTQEQIDAITNAFKQEEVTTGDTSKYKVFYKEDILNILNVENSDNEIIVNFETREIVSTIGIEYEGVVYYTQYKLPGGQTIINNSDAPDRNLFDFNAEIDSKIYNSLKISIDGLEATIEFGNIQIVNGTLKFAEIDLEGNATSWRTITNYTEHNKTYNAKIYKSGKYIFRLQDNENTENYKETTTEFKLTNKPKIENEEEIKIERYNYAQGSEEWAYATKDGVNYVWIPRFVYDTDNNIKFIKDNSNISTENTYMDYTWKIHDKFTTDETELTGIWVSVENAKQAELDMITLLNDNNRKTMEAI